MKLSNPLTLAFLLPLLILFSAARGAETTPKQIEDAIVQLGDVDPAVRNRASKLLREAGPAARKALQEAAKADDPEVAARAQEILRAAPATPATAKGAVEEELPEVIEYRAATPQRKQQIISRLGNPPATPEGILALTRLWSLETDQDLRTAIFDELLKSETWPRAASTLLADGSLTTAELLLTTAVDRKEPESASAYAAYWLSRGRLDEVIRRWAGRGGKQPVDIWAEQVLAALYRAKGDARAAMAHAEACEDSDVLRETLLWAGDWARIGAEAHKENVLATTVRDLTMMTGMDALVGDDKALEADLNRMMGLIHSEADAEVAANTMLMVSHPELAVKVLTDAQQYASVYELLNHRGQDDEAAALLAAHDGEKSAEAMALRAVAARRFAREGLKARSRELIDRVAKENGEIKFPRVNALLAEAEREAGMTEQAWEHFADAVEATPDDSAADFWNISRAFPTKENGVEWIRLWRASYSMGRRNKRIPPKREQFDLMRSQYERTIPIDDLIHKVKSVDVSSDRYEPYIRLAWEAALRMKKLGHEEDAVEFVTGIAQRAKSGELYIDLGDWAAEKHDWALAAERYGLAWRKDRTSALAMYLEGWAMERAGHAAEGRERMMLAHVVPLGDEKSRQEMLAGLLFRGLDDAAVREADVLIRTGHPLLFPIFVALRAAAEHSGDRGAHAVAAALWQRYLTNFLNRLNGPNANYYIRFEAGYLHLPDMVRRLHARALLAAGDWEGAQRDIKISQEILPTDSSVAIDLVPDLDKLGKKEEADALFAKIFATKQALCERYPDSAWHRNECAWLAAKCHRELDKALVHAKWAVELDPNNPADIDTLAEVYFHLGKFKEAVELEKKCVELSPEPIHRKQLARFEAGGK